MFFLIELWRNIYIKPSQLGRRYDQHIDDTLRNEVEGVCNSTYGYLVCVVRILNKERGRVQDGTGLIVVPVKYQAIVCKPFKNEVLDGIVSAVNQLGFFVQSGPLRAFVSRNDSTFTDGETTIQNKTRIRMRLQGVKYENTGIIAVATINENYLGPIGTAISTE